MKHSPLFEKNLIGKHLQFNTFSRQNCPLYPSKFQMTFFSHQSLFSNFSLPGCKFPITPSYFPFLFNFSPYSSIYPYICYVTQRLKTCHVSFWAFLFSHVLHWICFKILSTESTYLASN